MKTSSFLHALRSHAALPLVFRAGAEVVSPGYHLTEVKRVGYETMDCGGMMHRWSETQFEIWVPALSNLTPGRGHMAAAKFLRIVDRVQAELPLNAEATARIHASLAGQPAALYEIEAVEAHEGELRIELTPDRTRCKAAERRVAAALGGCCGSGAAAGEAEANSESAGAGCGCDAAKAREAEVACCA